MCSYVYRFSRLRYAAMILLGAVNVEYHITPSRIDAAIAAMYDMSMKTIGVNSDDGAMNGNKVKGQKMGCRCNVM